MLSFADEAVKRLATEPSSYSRHGRILRLIVALALLGTDARFTRSAGAQPFQSSLFSDADHEFFETQVRPLLNDHCYECHGFGDVEGGLRLTSRASILTGGETGPAIVAGDPAGSLLIDAIQYGDLYQMPPDAKLSDKDIETIAEWVRRGVPWPASEMAEEILSTEAEFDIEARKAAHWAWRPLDDPPVPKVQNADWPAAPLDRFILARLETAGIEPTATADPRALVRRAYFDVIGLPPPKEKVETFAADPTAAAFRQLIEELLASPRFGERWARHWLDLVCYAETRGHEQDYIIPSAWQYRDYVVRAFNADVPYNQFVTEHIAGDLLVEPRRHPTQGFNESLIATGFWYLGDWVHSPVDIRKDETDRIANAIDVYSKTFLGLTVACARCHDHKFDAISQEDYYALSGFLQSSGYRQARFETMEHNQRIARQLAELRLQTGRQLARQIASETEDIRRKMSAILSAAAEAVALHRNANIDGERASVAAHDDVSPSRLAAWVEELELAGDDENHPLYSLWLSSTRGFAAVSQWLAAQSCGSGPKRDEAHQVVVDFDAPNVTWLTDGPAWGAGPLAHGTLLPGQSLSRPLLEIVGVGRAELDPALADLELKEGTELPSGKLRDWGSRAGKTLRTPTVHLRGGKLYYLMRGGARIQVVVDSHRMIAGPLHGSTLMEVEYDQRLRWVEHDLSRYRGHGVHVEFGPDDTNRLQVWKVVEGSTPPSNPAWPTHATNLLQGASSHEDLIDRLAAAIEQSIESLCRNRRGECRATYAIAQWAANHPRLWAEYHRQETANLLAAYHERRELLLNQLKRESATAPAIWDGSAEDERLLVRGNPAAPGKLVPRRMLAAVAGYDQPLLEGSSGRLELAARTMAPDNPFPARVMVNRIWHHLLGTGIVPTVDNFGVLGQRPSHPELLDHLANRFVESGWSVKRLIRSIMLSRTYQMDSSWRPDTAEIDPQNLLFHRMRIKRLEAEAIRDAMLALSGRLDPTPFGPSVPVHLTEFMQGRGRPAESGPDDGAGRRSIYVAVRRNFLSPMMTAFDAPQPASPRGKRTVSNVPAQALMLLNDPFVRQQAEMFSARLASLAPNASRRIGRLYIEAFSRPPHSAETQAAQEFLERQTSEWAGVDDVSSPEQAAWADLCHVMFNTKEFIFLR